MTLVRRFSGFGKCFERQKLNKFNKSKEEEINDGNGYNDAHCASPSMQWWCIMTKMCLLGTPTVLSLSQTSNLSPLAQNQYMGFKVVLSKPLKMTNNQKYLCNAHNCVQNLGGAHISNVIFLILLLLFCCFMCVGIPTHVKYNAIFLIFPISQNWVCAS